jgi:hypothetical protein
MRRIWPVPASKLWRKVASVVDFDAAVDDTGNVGQRHYARRPGRELPKAMVIGKQRLRRDERGEDGKQGPDAHPTTPSVEAIIHNVFMGLYRHLWTQPERGVHIAFMAREVEGRTMRWVLVLLVLAGLCLPRVAAATEPQAMLHLAQAEDVKPLAQVLQTIGQRFPGHALDAELVRQGEPRYRVKWLGEDGKVREITADARSGQILDVR